jgi:TIR domain-containing protein/SIR2-like protein
VINKLISKLVLELSSTELSLSVEDLADALWLASLGLFQPALDAGRAVQEATKAQEPAPLTSPDIPVSDQHVEEPSRVSESFGAGERGRQFESFQEKAHLYVPRSDLQPLEQERGGLPLRSPAAPGLSNMLDLARALRPFRRVVPSRHARELDEDQTVRNIAEAKLWIPVLRASTERWLELAIVADVSPSMVAWQPTLRDIRLLSERLGAFRDVRMWVIDTRTRGRALLRTSQAETPRSPQELIDPTGRRVILVVSDCLAPAWNDSVVDILETWGRHQPVALLHLFPEYLWSQTALSRTRRAEVSSTGRGESNHRLRRTLLDAHSHLDLEGAIPFPVLIAEPEALNAWARLICRGATLVPAVIFTGSRDAEELEPNVEDALTPERRVALFRNNSSKMAFRLAHFLAAAPLRLPIMRLIQRTMLPLSQQVHFAEVIASGMLERITPPEVNDADLIEFDFFPGVREVLLDVNDVQEVVTVQQVVSRYVNERFGSTFDFQAVLENPNLGGALTVAPGLESFAAVTATVLERLGGRYAQLARHLRTVADRKARPVLVGEIVPLEEEKSIPQATVDQSLSKVRTAVRQEDREGFWDDLLALIEEGKIIPVIGEHAVTTAPDDAPLYPWLAQRLANSLDISSERLHYNPSLNDVVSEWLRRGGERTKIYPLLHRILREEPPSPGSALRDLAAVSDFNLFITTTFDRLLERTLNQDRFAGQERTQVRAFSPRSWEKDLPARKRELSVPTVYHIFGRASVAPDFVAWEEDALEFVCAFHEQLGVMERLAQDLKEYGLLMLGLNFSDWLLRFFLQITKQTRLSWPRSVGEYLVEGPSALPESMVLFFGAIGRSMRVISMEPVSFAAELAHRWRQRRPDLIGARATVLPLPTDMPHGAIFLSYDRRDQNAVVRLKSALEQAGCVVWYDRERLKPGDYWLDKLEQEILERCSLFVSVISKNTETVQAAYFHRERALAAQRTQQFSPGEEFYVPVIIDDSPFELAREPRLTREVQITRAPGGNPPLGFAERLGEIQRRRTRLV